MSLQDLAVLGYDPKELEKLRDEFNFSDECIKYHATMIWLYCNDQRVNSVSPHPIYKRMPTNGKMPYIGREHPRKYGNEELCKELMDENSI